MDTSAARWAEEAGYDITYASSIDLHDSLIDASQYTAVIFSGHDEYWSKDMRDCAEDAVAVGTHLAFLGSNNVSVHIRVEPAVNSRDGRPVTCYLQDEDPESARRPDRTLAHTQQEAEHGLLGVQCNGIGAKPVPLVVRESDHLFWVGTACADNDEIPELVAVEADRFDPSVPRPETRHANTAVRVAVQRQHGPWAPDPEHQPL